MNISCKAARRIQVVIHNMTDHSVTLLPKHVIGEISAADTVMPFSSKQSPSFQPELRDEMCREKRSFDLDNLFLIEEWKTQITDTLSSVREVFATNGTQLLLRITSGQEMKRPEPVNGCDRVVVKQE